jgi:hypothetical protein
VKDNLSLIAAATGGFMLAIAVSGILQGPPVIEAQTISAPVTNVSFIARKDAKALR